MIDKFKNVRTSVKNKEEVGRTSTSFTDANMKRVHDMILQNRRVSIDEVAHQLQIRHVSAYEIIKNRLAFRTICAQRVPNKSQNCTNIKVWTSANGFWIAMVLKATTSWKECSREMKHGSTITRQRVKARVWNGNILALPGKKKKFKTHPTAGKLMLTVFGSHKGH